jgi:hypothetical protein
MTTTTDTTTTDTTQPADLAALLDHHGVVDAAVRYTTGLDTGDADLMASALTEDAVVDVTPAMSAIGLDFPVLSPRDTVVGGLIGAVGRLQTSHSVTNARSTVDTDDATLSCYVDAVYRLPRGEQEDRTVRHAQMMIRYTTRLVRADGGWRIRHLRIDGLWFDGDPQVLLSQG